MGHPQQLDQDQLILIFFSLVILCLGIFILGKRGQEKSGAQSNKIYKNDLLINILLFAVILLFLIYPIQFTINFLTFKFPLEYRDAASISSAVDFSRGINLYSIENFPDHIYLYGFLYPLIMAPFIKFVANPILIARFIDVLFLILFLGISFWILRKRNTSIISSLIAVLILLNSFCFIWFINGSRPDTSGLFFSLLGIIFIIKDPNKTINIFLCAFFV